MSNARTLHPMLLSHRQRFSWLTPSLAISIMSLVIAGAVAIGSVGNRIDQQEKEIAELRVNSGESRKLLMDLNASVQVLLDRTDPFAVHPRPGAAQ